LPQPKSLMVGAMVLDQDDGSSRDDA